GIAKLARVSSLISSCHEEDYQYQHGRTVTLRKGRLTASSYSQIDACNLVDTGLLLTIMTRMTGENYTRRINTACHSPARAFPSSALHARIWQLNKYFYMHKYSRNTFIAARLNLQGN